MTTKTALHKLLPLGTRRRALVKKVIDKVRGRKPARSSLTFNEWIHSIEPKTASPVVDYTYRPLISIVVPAFNTPDKYLDPLVDSVIDQTYTNWELCLVQGGSPDPSRAEAIRKASERDERIKLIEVKANLGIAGNTNAGIKQAKGSYIAFLDHDDTLASFALNEVVAVLQKDRKIDVFYSDEDKLSDDGRTRSLPLFKPDWSPEMFLGVNYLAHFVVVRADLVRKLGGIREGFDGAQDYDFLLRVVSTKPRIHHIPKLSYHWRMADGSTARAIESKGYADDAGQRALRDYVKREGINAEVLPVEGRPTNYRLKYAVVGHPLISIIIPFKDKVELLKTLLDSIEALTTYRNYELVLVSNNSVESATHEYLRSLNKTSGIKVIEYNQPFNYSAVCNYGRKHANGELLLILNNDMKVTSPEWLEELAGVAVQPWAGVVGGWLFYPDGRTQHAGVVMGMTGMAGHVFRFRKPGEYTDFGIPDWPRNFLAVTGACTMIRAELFDHLGGYDEEFIVCGSDVVLCLRAYEAGYRNVFWPFAKLTHYESVSVGSYDKIPPGDYDRSMTYYRPYLNGHDPYYNPNLDLAIEGVAIGVTHED